MSEFLFGSGRGHLGRRAALIAQQHGAELVDYTDPGCSCGYGCDDDDCPALRRHWFTADNFGSPFDRDLSAAVLSDLRAAGIITPGGRPVAD